MEKKFITHTDWILAICDCPEGDKVDIYYEDEEVCKVLGLMKILEEMNIYAELRCESWQEEESKNDN